MIRWTLLYRVTVLALLAAIVLEVRDMRGAPTMTQEVRAVKRAVDRIGTRQEEVAPRPAGSPQSPLDRQIREASERQIQDMLRDGAPASQPGR